MNYSASQVVNGLISYADAEIMPKLPTTSKFIVGTALILAKNKMDSVIEYLLDSSMLEILEVVDDNGNIDVDSVITAMKASSDKYGKVTFDINYIGKMSFASSDFDSLRKYIQ